MGILLILLGILLAACIIGLSSTFSQYDHREIGYRIRRAVPNMVIWAIVISSIYGTIAIPSLMGSYDSYLDARAYYDNLIAQYKGAIVLYEDKAVSLDMEKAAKYALTDLRFQGYQEKMGDFVMDLREKVTKYNSCIIKKRLMKKNFFYNWYIIPPDADMHTIDIISK